LKNPTLITFKSQRTTRDHPESITDFVIEIQREPIAKVSKTTAIRGIAADSSFKSTQWQLPFGC
jgi:hypothetical protein